jgi:hypothetical protein
MSKLTEELDAVANMIEFGDRIAWGTDTTLLRIAAERIRELEKKLETAGSSCPLFSQEDSQHTLSTAGARE